MYGGLFEFPPKALFKAALLQFPISLFALTAIYSHSYAKAKAASQGKKCFSVIFII